MVPMDAKPTQKSTFCSPRALDLLVLHSRRAREHGRSQSQDPVRYSLEPVVVEGKFNVLPNDPYGLFYRW